MIDLLLEKKKFDDKENLVFKGLRFDDDAAFKFAHFLGQFLGEDEVFIGIQDNDDFNRYRLSTKLNIPGEDVPSSDDYNIEE